MGTIVPPAPVQAAFRQREDKRIGRRAPVSDLTIDWQPVAAEAGSWFERRRRRAGRESTAKVVDLSVSGAQVAVVGPQLVSVGAKVHIGLDGAAGTASVRRAVHGPGGRSFYGIQFLLLDPVLTRRIAGLLTGDRAHLEARWGTGR